MTLKKTFVALLILTLPLMSACSTGVGAEAGQPYYERSTGETLDDTVVLSKVKTLLIRDPEISGLDIDVNVFNGTVTLKGFVNDREEARRAVKIARSVPHVKEVNSKLVLDGEKLEVF